MTLNDQYFVIGGDCPAALSDSSSDLIVKVANLENELAELKAAKKTK